MAKAKGATPYHYAYKETLHSWGGEACSFMVLNEIENMLGATPKPRLAQSLKLDDVKNGKKWDGDPRKIADTLTVEAQNILKFNNFFTPYIRTVAGQSKKDTDDGRRVGNWDIWNTLDRYEVSPVVLVHGGKQWVVVREMNLDANNDITSVEFRVPDESPQDPVTTHHPTDKCQGDKARNTRTFPGNRGTADEWKTWFRPAPYDAPRQFISVCDPDPRGEPAIEILSYESPADGTRIIEAFEAQQYAELGFERYEFGGDEHIVEVLDASEWHERDSSLVVRLDEEDSFYYLLPRVDPDGQIIATATVDARYGDLGILNYNPPEPDTDFVPDGQETEEPEPLDYWPVNSPAEAEDRILERNSYPLPEGGGFRVRSRGLEVADTLVWKPCRESATPLLPFYYGFIGGHSLYVRVDGLIFTELTDGWGM